MVFLSGVDDITGMPIPQAVPARIAKPVRASIRKAVKARIAKQVKARIVKPVPPRIPRPWYAEGSEGQGTSGYHLSGFGDVDEITGIQIDSGVPATIAKPVPARIAPGPSGAIQSAVPATILPGPSGAIVRGPGGDADNRDGLPLRRSIKPIEITGATAVLPAFPVPGAGEEAKTLAPTAIKRGPSGKIESLKQAGSTPNREAALFYIRQRLQPLIKTLAELPANERGPALREALDLLGQPNAEPAIRRLSAEYIAKGTQPQIAFQEALARVLATAFLVVAPVQYLAEQGAAQDIQGLDGVGDFFNSVGRGIKKGAKAVGKAAMKVVHKVVDLYEDVACSSVGKAVADKAGQVLVGAPPGAGGTAVCSSAKMSEYLTAEVAHAVGAKKKNPSFKAYAKSVGAEIVAGVGRATNGAGGMGGALTQIKLPDNLQKISDDLRSKVDNNKILTFTRKELESKVPGVKKLSKEQLDVITTQIADRAATPEAYGDKPRDTVLVGTPPKKAKPREKSAYEQALEAAKQREAAKTPADRAREKAEGERWRKENESRYASSSKNPSPMPNLRPVGPQIPDMQPAAPKSSKMPLILLGVGVVGALLYVRSKRKAQ